MQLIAVKSNESLLKCHDSPKRSLPVQFSYHLLVFIRFRGWNICQLTVSPPWGICQFHLKNANARGLAPGGGGMGTGGID